MTSILTVPHRSPRLNLTPSRPVPGWELPLSWTTPDTDHNGGPRRCGRLTLRYSSDPAKGCAPIWKLRETLISRVLVGDKPQKLL